LKPHLQTTLRTLLEAGASQREIERVTGIDRKTIRSYQRKFAEGAANSPGVATDPEGELPPPRPPTTAAAGVVTSASARLPLDPCQGEGRDAGRSACRHATAVFGPSGRLAPRPGTVPRGQVIDCNLTRLSRLLRILPLHAHDLDLVPVQAAYRRHGKGPRQYLRFTRTGDPNLAAAYARHFVRRPLFQLTRPTEVADSGRRKRLTCPGSFTDLRCVHTILRRCA